jgi:ACS family D-galactonate transporter-like MFS transporter
VSEITPVRQRGALLAINKAVATSAGLIGPYIMGSQIQQSASNAADGYASGFFV